MTAPRRLARMLLSVAVLATGGCLATQGDVTKLQLSIRMMQDSLRLQQARSDSLSRMLVRDVAQQLSRQFSRDFGVASDSIRQLSNALQRLQGDVSLSMHELRGQLIAMQEGIGQSQKRIQDLKMSVEATAAAPVVPVPRGPDSAAAGRAAGATPGAPPAAQLFSMARGQLISGATGAAREGFQTLLAEYPKHDLAGEAQMGIADAYAQEGNRAAADSVYALVTARYEDPYVVSRSLYKRALFMMEAQQLPQARALFEQIVARYPRSDAGQLAADMLRTLKKP